MAKKKIESLEEVVVESAVVAEVADSSEVKPVKGVARLEEEGDRASLAIVGGKLRHLVGSDGEVLDAIQELTRLAVQTSTGDRSRLMLDIDNFRSNKKSELKKLANEMADEARSTGKSIKLAPMNAFERKIIHDTIQELGLTSESDGEDPNRYVVIYSA